MNELIRSALAAEPGSVTRVSDLVKRLRQTLPDLRTDEVYVGLAGFYPLAAVNSCAVIVGFRLS